MRRISATGRVRMFNTLVGPNQVAERLGVGSGLDTARVQEQTRVARATGILGLAKDSISHDQLEMDSGAPEVVALSEHPLVCASRAAKQPEPQYVAGMPQRAPAIVESRYGPMYFQGAESTVPGSYPVDPPSDGGVMSWAAENPWWVLVLAGAGVLALSRRSGR